MHVQQEYAYDYYTSTPQHSTDRHHTSAVCPRCATRLASGIIITAGLCCDTNQIKGESFQHMHDTTY